MIMFDITVWVLKCSFRLMNALYIVSEMESPDSKVICCVKTLRPIFAIIMGKYGLF